MTVNKLHKILGELIRKGHGRKKVAVDKPSFWDGNETFTICDVNSIEPIFVGLSDGDGFQEFDSRGGDRGSIHVVLSGLNK